MLVVVRELLGVDERIGQRLGQCADRTRSLFELNTDSLPHSCKPAHLVPVSAATGCVNKPSTRLLQREPRARLNVKLDATDFASLRRFSWIKGATGSLQDNDGATGSHKV